MIEALKEFGLENIFILVQIIALVPFFNMIEKIFSYGKFDEIMLDRSKQRLHKTIFSIIVIIMFILLTLSLIYVTKMLKVQINSEVTEYIVSKIFHIILITFIWAILFIKYDVLTNVCKIEQSSKLNKFIATLLFVIGLLCSATILITGDKCLNILILIVYYVILCSIVYILFFRRKFDINRIVTYNNIFKLMFFFYFLGIIYLSYNNINKTTLVNYILIFSFMLFALMKYIIFKTQKVCFFNCTYEFSKKYNIRNKENDDYRTGILFIYHTVNGEYFVCGEEIEVKSANKFYLLRYEDVITSGGFNYKNLN